MATRPQVERIREDGLRYAKKKSGSGFGLYKNTRSCFVCSKHHPQSEGVTVGLMGKSEFFCSTECKEKVIKPRKAELI